MSVTDASGHMIRVQHSKYDPKVAKANKLGNSHDLGRAGDARRFRPPGSRRRDYSVQVKGLDSTTGTYLVGFYLPGDVAGTGQVTQADFKTIKKDKGMTAENSNYNFDADVNRDGVINGQDLKLAKEDLGASTTVSPVVSVNLDPASNPAADRTCHTAPSTSRAMQRRARPSPSSISKAGQPRRRRPIPRRVPTASWFRS